jgi:DUF4097 and DUF4098 domain-containing protein YvlB
MDNTTIDYSQSGNRVSVQTRNLRAGDRGMMISFGQSLCSVEYDIEVPRDCSIRAKSVSADVSIEGVRAPLTAQTVSGNLSVAGITGECSLTTVSGNLVGRNIVGELTLRTTSGDARVTSSRVQRFNVNTVSGDCDIETPLTRGTSPGPSVVICTCAFPRIPAPP